MASTVKSITQSGSFGHALAFMQPIIREDTERWRVLDSEQSATIETDGTERFPKRGAVPGSLL